MSRPPECKGIKYSVEAIVNCDGSCPAGDFLDKLSPSDRRKLDVQFEIMANRGKISNKERFKKIEGSDGIFEFKSFQIRIPCFFTPDQRLMLCFGVIKKKDRLDPQEIKRAQEIRSSFLRRHAPR